MTLTKTKITVDLNEYLHSRGGMGGGICISSNELDYLLGRMDGYYHHCSFAYFTKLLRKSDEDMQ